MRYIYFICKWLNIKKKTNIKIKVEKPKAEMWDIAVLRPKRKVTLKEQNKLKRNTCPSFKNTEFFNHILKKLENP